MDKEERKSKREQRKLLEKRKDEHADTENRQFLVFEHFINCCDFICQMLFSLIDE